MSSRDRGPDPEDELVPLLVPRSAIVAVMPRPLAVTQLNCKEIFGITPEEFTADARAMRFPNMRRGHKRIASIEDAAKFYLPTKESAAVASDPSAKPPSAPFTQTQPKALDLDAMMKASVERTRK
jgi:hypothetical protein